MSNQIFDKIEKILQDHGVVLFIKGTPSQPLCGFSSIVVQILDKLGVEFFSVNILEDQEMRQGIKDFSHWPTVPQLYIKEEFIGGSDIVRELYGSGELLKILDAKAVPYRS